MACHYDIFRACKAGCVDCTLNLVGGIADLNIRHHNITLLQYAMMGANTECFKILMNRGADINYQDTTGATPLYCAVSSFRIQFMKMIITYGADTNKPNYFGYTPLHIASSQNRIESVRLLLEAGADPSLKNTNGETPADFSNNEEIKGLLKAYEGILDVKYALD